MAEETLTSALIYKRYVGALVVVGPSIEHAQNILSKLGFVYSSIPLNFEDYLSSTC